MESKQGRLEVEFDTTMSFFFGVETGVIEIGRTESRGPTDKLRVLVDEAIRQAIGSRISHSHIAPIRRHLEC
jgi:hypothetical protein